MKTKSKNTDCPHCDGSGVVDSGGVTPWGSAIDLPCPSCHPTNTQKQQNRGPLYLKHKMTIHGQDPITHARYIEGFNNALKLGDSALESAVFALKRSFYEADAIAEGRNKTFICAPIIRDYCRKALEDLGVSV